MFNCLLPFRIARYTFEFLFHACVRECATGTRALCYITNAFNLFTLVRMLFSTFADYFFHIVILHEIFICQRNTIEMRTEYLHDSIRNEMYDGFIPTIEQIEHYYLLLTVKCVVLLHVPFALSIFFSLLFSFYLTPPYHYHYFFFFQ